MKVILLAPTPPPAGGIAGWTYRMQRATLKNNWKVEVVDEKVIGKREVFGNNKRKIFTEIKRTIKIWRNLFKTLKDKEVALVHSCIPATTTAMMRELGCAIITKLHKKKFIIHYRCTINNMVKSKVSLLVFKCLSYISDLAIVLNMQSLDFIKSYSKVDSIIIPNFIEKNEVINETGKFISEKVSKIVYVGGVIEEKGCCDIIEVAKEFPEIQFRLIGKAEEKILTMEKTNNVFLLGERCREEVEEELKKADIFMFVTYYSGEGFSNALAEAMAKGVPCIVSDWAANKDMIENGGGIVVEKSNICQMINAIDKLKNNKDLRKSQSLWNINKVTNCYIETIVTGMYVDVYEKVSGINVLRSNNV